MVLELSEPWASKHICNKSWPTFGPQRWPSAQYVQIIWYYEQIMKRRRSIQVSCELKLYTHYTITWSLHILNQFLLEFHGFFSSPIHITITSVAELNIHLLTVEHRSLEAVASSMGKRLLCPQIQSWKWETKILLTQSGRMWRFCLWCKDEYLACIDRVYTRFIQVGLNWLLLWTIGFIS